MATGPGFKTAYTEAPDNRIRTSSDLSISVNTTLFDGLDKY
jgi:hypothetical protein